MSVVHGLSRLLGQDAHLVASGVLVPVSLVTWVVGVRQIYPSPIPLSILPAGSVVLFLTGLGLLVVSTGLLLTRPKVSGRRMTLNLGAFLVMLYGSAPIVYSEPRFSWLYKHAAITNSIAVHDALSRSLDIYRIWPGFFALAAWVDKVAGVATPLVYASWAQLFFEVLYAIVFAWVLKALPIDERERWFALFLFVGANWIAQDYFSPQAFALVLSFGVFGTVLHWLTTAQRSWVTRLEGFVSGLLRRGRSRLLGYRTFMAPPPRPHHLETGGHDQNGAAATDRARWFAIGAVLLIYGVLTFVHELSPYVVAAQLGALVIVGLIRPWWLVVAMLAIAVGFLAPNFRYVNDTYGLTASIGNFFGNVKGPSSTFSQLGSEAMRTATAARVLSVAMWGLALIGIVRRLHQGRPAIGLAVLAFSPLALLVLLAYGSEGVLRVYLFSLPWTACLAASALRMEPKPFWHPKAIVPTAALAAVTLLFLVAFFGDDGVNVMTPADVQATMFVYSRAAPGPLMSLAENAPAPIGPNFSQFQSVEPLLGSDYPGITVLSPTDIAFITSEILDYGGGVTEPGYFIVTPSMFAYAEEYGLATAAQCRTFVAAMDRAPGWTILYSHGGATVYELALGP